MTTQLLCGVVMALVAATALADASAPAPPANRIVLTPAEAHACFGDTGYVTLTATQIARVEAALPRGLDDAAAHAPNPFLRDGARHVRQTFPRDVLFFAGIADGHIRVLGYNPTIIQHTGTQCPPDVNDGGWSVWSIRYDVKRGTFDRFATNGEG